jgi:hypothetical protein
MTTFRMNTTGNADSGVVSTASAAIEALPEISTASQPYIIPSVNVVSWIIDDNTPLTVDDVAQILLDYGYVTTGMWT